MVYHGKIKNGVVVFDEAVTLPDGAQVEIVVPEPVVNGEAEEEIPTLYEQYKDIIGIIKDMPEDFAENHDHYIHGTPKRV